MFLHQGMFFCNVQCYDLNFVDLVRNDVYLTSNFMDHTEWPQLFNQNAGNVFHDQKIKQFSFNILTVRS